MKSANHDFDNHLCDSMEHLNYKPCQKDLDLWFMISRLANELEYYEYCLVYVDDYLMIGENPKHH